MKALSEATTATMPRRAAGARPRGAGRVGELIPPHDVDAEQSALGAMLLQPEAAAVVLERLDPRDFFRPAHRTVFEAARAVVERGAIPDPVTVGAELRRTRRLNDAGGKAFLFDLLHAVPSASAAPEYVRVIADLATRRRCLSTARDVAAGVVEGVDLPSLTDRVDALRTALGAGSLAEYGRRPALDVTALSSEEPDADSAIVEDLIYPGSVLVVTGEEGKGKTELVDQAMRQLIRREPILSFFEPGQYVVERVLMIDTEMDAREVARRCARMEARGLDVPPGRFFWMSTGAIDLAGDADDRAFIRREVERTRAQVVWVDAAGSAVSDPKEDVAVRAFFDFLRHLMDQGVVAVGITHHPRKRGQGEYGRRFDDLFGSREWKGKATKVLYADDGRLVAWKDRGRHLHRRWPVKPGTSCPVALLDRPGTSDENAVPFAVRGGPPDAAYGGDVLRANAVRYVQEQPDRYTKTTLAEQLGGNRRATLAVVGQLISEGALGPDKPRAVLRVRAAEGVQVVLPVSDPQVTDA